MVRTFPGRDFLITVILARTARKRAFTSAILLACLALAGSGCAPYSPLEGDFRLPVATLASAARPIDGNGGRELRGLGQRPADLLRRSWILMETRRPMQAIHSLNRVLSARPIPRSDTLALAHYLRARAFQHRGNKARAVEDCQRARQLTRRADLRRRCDADIARLRPPPVRKAPKVAVRGVQPVTIIPRHRWNAAAPIKSRLDPMRGIQRLTIHHSAVLSRKPNARAVAISVRSIQNYHVQENRYGDIGYHFLIDPAGRVWEGRDLRYQGAHAGGTNNEHNVGICLLGNFVPGRSGQYPTSQQVNTMERLVSWLGSRYAIHRQGVLTHKELKPGTACPGSRLQAVVNRMRQALASNRREPDWGTPGGAK